MQYAHHKFCIDKNYGSMYGYKPKLFNNKQFIKLAAIMKCSVHSLTTTVALSSYATLFSFVLYFKLCSDKSANFPNLYRHEMNLEFK